MQVFPHTPLTDENMASKIAPLLARRTDFFIIAVILLSVFQPSTQQGRHNLHLQANTNAAVK